MSSPKPTASKPKPACAALPPLFMWAGGKRRLLPKYAPWFPPKGTFDAYVEPFMGGGAVFSHVAALQPGIPCVLGEINSELARLYRDVRDNHPSLLAAAAVYEAAWMPLSLLDRKAYYYRLRETYWALDESVASSALLYFLMKTGFNGIWQSCIKAKGRFATPVGLATQTNRVIDPAVVVQWSLAMANTEVRAQSYENTVVPMASFVYCDPPYRGSFTSYGTVFDDAAQRDLIAWCRQVARTTHSLVWLANRQTGDGFFEQHAADAHRIEIPVVYTAGRRKRTSNGFAAQPATELLLIWDERLPTAKSNLGYFTVDIATDRTSGRAQRLSMPKIG